jgi:hypothetical protein
LDAFQIVRFLCKQQRGENPGHDRPHSGQRERWISVVPHPFALQESVRDRGEYDVMMPGRIRPPLEVVESQLGL